MIKPQHPAINLINRDKHSFLICPNRVFVKVLAEALKWHFKMEALPRANVFLPSLSVASAARRYRMRDSDATWTTGY